MASYILRKLLLAIPALFGVTLIVFAIASAMPGDAVLAMISAELPSSEQLIAMRRGELGLDQPIWLQYGHWLGQVAQGNLGRSFVNGRGVGDLLLERLPVTVELMGVALEHEGMNQAAADRRAADMLDPVGIANPAQRMRGYPHHPAADALLSGAGMAISSTARDHGAPSGRPSRAVWLTMITSQHTASSSPPPRAKPSIAAMVGYGRHSSRSKRRRLWNW